MVRAFRLSMLPISADERSRIAFAIVAALVPVQAISGVRSSIPCVRDVLFVNYTFVPPTAGAHA